MPEKVEKKSGKGEVALATCPSVANVMQNESKQSSGIWESVCASVG